MIQCSALASSSQQARIEYEWKRHSQANDVNLPLVALHDRRYLLPVLLCRRNRLAQHFPHSTRSVLILSIESQRQAGDPPKSSLTLEISNDVASESEFMLMNFG